MNDETFYYLDESNQPAGPLSLSEIVALNRDGKLPETPVLCREGEQEWKPLVDFLPRAAEREMSTSSKWLESLKAAEKPYRSWSPKAAIICGMAAILMVFLSRFLAFCLAVAAIYFARRVYLDHRSKAGEAVKSVPTASLWGFGTAGFALLLLLFVAGPSGGHSPSKTTARSGGDSYMPSLEEMRQQHEVARELFFLQHGDTIEAGDRWARETARFAEELERAKRQ